MAVSEKAKEKLDEAGKEIREAVDNLRHEVAGLKDKVKEKIKGTGEDVRESAEEIARELKVLSEKVSNLIPRRNRKSRLPVSVDRHSRYPMEAWEQPFIELRKATDRLFEDFFRGFRGQLPVKWNPWELTPDIFGIDGWPRVDMSETDEEVKVTAELPGVEKDNIDISVTDDRITIRGQKEEKEEKRKRGYYQMERSFGSFQRSFMLPCEVESDQVDASFKDGVLSVTLPKSAAARERTKKIPVRAG